MAGKIDVSIITTHRGDPLRLTNLLSSLERQSYPLDRVEWVVVDDASPEGAPSWFQLYEGPLDIVPIALEENLGRAKARNLAIKKARGKILAFIDGDMEAGSVWLEMLVRGVKTSGGVVLGCHDPHPSLPDTAWIRYYHSRGAHKHQPGDAIPGRYYASGDSALHAKLIKEHGVFDERFSSWGGEDLEFGFRLEKAGIPFSYEPRARILHNHYRDWKEAERNYLHYGDEAIPLLLDIHPELADHLSLTRLLGPSSDDWLSFVKYNLLRQSCKPFVYNLLKAVTLRCPRLPWPDKVFDFMIFYLYSRSFRAQHGV
ncbi:glycosyltransferase [bacterium]|nr:glycosyltransferase [bacterium]